MDRSARSALASAFGALLLLAAWLPAHAVGAPKPGGVTAGTWVGVVSQKNPKTKKSFPVKFELVRVKGAAPTVELKLLQVTDTCTFPPASGMTTPAPKTVTWLFRDLSAWTKVHGPVDFTFAAGRSRGTFGPFDLDQNHPGPLSLVKITFTSPHAAVGKIEAGASNGQALQCFTGPKVDNSATSNTQVTFKIHTMRDRGGSGGGS